MVKKEQVVSGGGGGGYGTYSEVGESERAVARVKVNELAAS